MNNETSEPDLTPMLDVVFILLIFFIVTASFINETGIALPSSKNRSDEASSDKSIVVEVTSKNKYKIQNRYVDLRALKNRLSAYHAEAPEQSLVVKAHPNAEVGALVYAMDVGRMIGMEIGLAGGA